MHTSVYILFYFLQISAIAWADSGCPDEDQKDVSFSAEGLRGKRCKDLDRDSCIFQYDTKKQCPCYCNKLVYEEESQNNQGQSKPSSGKHKKLFGFHRKCFHGDDFVITDNVGEITMQQLANGTKAMVLTANGFSKVRFWIHADPNAISKFLILQTSAGQELSISDDHLIYRSIDCNGDQLEAVFAKRLKVGDCLRVFDEARRGFIFIPLSKISIVKKIGIYAPITETGSIVVNGIVASSYTNYEDEHTQKMVYGLMLNLFDFLSDWTWLKWLSSFIFGDRTSFVAKIPRFMYSLVDMSYYFIHN